MSDAKSPAKKAHPLVAAMVKAAVEWKIKSPKKGVIRICDCQKVPEDIDESELLKHLMTIDLAHRGPGHGSCIRAES